MSADEIEVFAICHAESIAPGEARSFRLSRRTEDGEVRPFPIFVVRRGGRDFFGYVNACPHNGTWLNISTGGFFNRARTHLECGRHKAQFDIESGLCVEGGCKGKSLTPLALTVIGGDVCLCGVPLAEDDQPRNPFEEPDETMEITIHP